METAGRLVEDETLRDALKENGIGRPSTRAAIIETLFKRHYIRKERKNLIATPTGVELIGLIREELLKSAELTGIWERKLRQIEKNTYDAKTFLEELKSMVADIVHTVLADNTNRRVTLVNDNAQETDGKTSRTPQKGSETKKRTVRQKKAEKAVENKTSQEKPQDSNLLPGTLAEAKADMPAISEGSVCPLCGKGHVIKGKTAFGCSEWKNGCTFRLPIKQ